MGWTDLARQYYFADDELFAVRYCSPRTLAYVVAGPGEAGFASFRRVARQLTVLMPDAVHSTPGWNGAPVAALVVGTPNIGGRITGAGRLGLCTFEGGLHLWMDERLDAPEQFGQVGQNPAWSLWRAVHNGANAQSGLWRYNTPVDLAANEPEAAHPLHPNGPLGALLSWLANTRQEAAPQQLQELLDPCRSPEEAAMPGQPIHPLLLWRWANSE